MMHDDIRHLAEPAPPSYRTLSVVVPFFNESEVLPEFHKRLAAVLADIPLDARILYVNDGSSDQSAAIIEKLSFTDTRVTLLELSRNFGKEIALTAGLDHADSDAVVIIDADLQDPPELIPALVEEWGNGFDVVYAQRISRHGETWLKKASAFLFYRCIRTMTRIGIPEDTGDYRLLSRRAVNALCQLREQHRFMKGLFSWIGFPQKAVPYEREARYAGTTKWGYWRLWNFAIEGITSFTTAPLKVATYIGFLTALIAFVYGIYIVGHTLIDGNPVPGYPSLLTVILFLGGVQLFSIGTLGEYLARMSDESKKRPLYILKEHPKLAHRVKLPADLPVAAGRQPVC